MIDVPLYPNGYPCKCSGKCDFSKAYERAGKPLQIDYESYIKRDYIPATKKQRLILEYLQTTYCLNK